MANFDVSAMHGLTPRREQNSPSTLAEARVHITAISKARSVPLASYHHAYALGWIDALLSAGQINEWASKQLATEASSAFERRCPPVSG